MLESFGEDLGGSDERFTQVVGLLA